MRTRMLVMATVLGLLVSSLAFAESMASQYKPNLQRSFCEATEKAADFLVMSQMPLRSGKVGWSWVLGDGSHPDNIAGLAALGLLDAYAATGKDKYLAAARRYADGLVDGRSRYSAKNLPYKADIELLARLGGMPQGDTYQQAAKDLQGLIQARSPEAAKEIDRIAAGRSAEPALLGFDAALAVRAATAAGERSYAYALADAVLGRLSTWYQPVKDPRYSLVSAASLVVALERLDAGRYRATVDRLREDLRAAQNQNGSWIENETQPSAYAAQGLWGSPAGADQEGALRALAWIKTTMLRSGGFAHYNDGMPEPFVGQMISEVNAEALSALAGACRGGLDGK